MTRKISIRKTSIERRRKNGYHGGQAAKENIISETASAWHGESNRHQSAAKTSAV
jgi:hypothetical protein